MTGPVCGTCSHAEFRGLPPKGSPAWEVGTIGFWCRRLGGHGMRADCPEHEPGKPVLVDKRGRLMEHGRRKD